MSQATTTLKRRGAALARADEQLRILSHANGFANFAERLAESGKAPLQSDRIEILQINLGKLCNMTCAHCHVDAGPDRRESMDLATVEACLEAVRQQPEISTLDLTGGAPEMNPHFERLVCEARALGRHVIDRCNLTILLAAGFEHVAEFLAEKEVEIVASLPCYLEENTDAQRGDGAFAQSIESLQRLNQLGYGEDEGRRMLTLVYNPIGASLPPDQRELESAYRRELASRYGVRFNRLFAIANMPISRFLDHLVQTQQYERYMRTLVDAFNPAAVQGLMCRNTLSVGWDGQLYDCDFNQMLELGVAQGLPGSIHDYRHEALARRAIVVGQHCFGCTASAGSGCQGAIDA